MLTIPRTRLTRPLVGVTALAILTGCGGVATKDSSKGLDGDVRVVKIAAPYPLSGTWAAFGQNSLAGMKAAAQAINDAGGIEALAGAKVEIVSGDTTGDPGQGQAMTTKLLQDNKVTAAVGSYLSNITLTTSTAAESAQVPMITQSFVDTLTSRGYKYLFQLPPRSSSLGSDSVKFYLQIAKSQGRQVRRAAIVSSNDAAGKAQANAVAKAAKAAGITTGDPIIYPPGITDATAVVGKIVALGPDVVFSYGPVPDTALIVKNLRERGVTAPIMGTGGTGLLDKGIPQALGAQAEGLLSLSAWNDDMKLPGVAEATAAYKKANPGAAFMPQEAGESYVAVFDIVQAVEQANSADPQKVRDALSALQAADGPAAAMPAGKVAFDGTGINRYASAVVIQWQGGVPHTVWPADVAAAPVK